MRMSKTGPALVLLFLATAGLFMMHTLGHLDTGHPTHGAAVHQVANAPQDEPEMPLGSMVMCVAILCGLLVLALAVVLVRRARTGLHLFTRPLACIADAVRGPPVAPIGFTLADLSVWRN